jgi:hypothetical protein
VWSARSRLCSGGALVADQKALGVLDDDDDDDDDDDGVA